ncbi:hypothetical protein PGT21_018261 [Puccinia graminis f. sp. tritici]|uniref:Uncharacterized protein n=1 Tax=Puccinia graminis f. sp. tritici TaxID=56615 RepID=A0A5B0PFC6_PUCGR|nr:hypothetical protein PGT21_018261 [Puccinia graminis f. sp. tritici]
MLTSGPPHRGSSICTCHWQLSEDRLGTPRSGFQPLLSQNNHQHQAHHCQIVVIASSAENRHLAAKWVCPRPYSEGQQLTDVISSSANNQQATAPPPSSPQAPNNSNPSASADGIELVPPSTQPPLENERTWVHLSTSMRHPPSSPQAPILLLQRPQPPEAFCLGRRNRPSPPLHPAAFAKRNDPGRPIDLGDAPPPPFSPQAPNHLEPSASADGIDHLPPYTQLPLQNETTRVDPSTSATHPPRFSPQAPNHLEPSASADGIDHLPPYTQLPFENETTRVDPSTSATHPPRSLPRPPTTWSLLPRPTESTISPPTPSCLCKTKRPGSTHRPRRRTPPPFSPQAPNHLEPSASADGIDHLPPYTQLPFENETTRVDPSTSATHPPFSLQAPSLPLDRFFLSGWRVDWFFLSGW